MPITVLVALAAATIAMVTLRQAYGSIEAAANRNAERQARALVESERSAIEASLNADSTMFLTTVWPNEAPRVCATASPGSDPVVGGSPWPSSCGWVWEYEQQPINDGDVRVHITPPTGTGVELQVTIAAQVEQMRYGSTYSYQPSGSGRWTVWSGSNVNLAALSNGSSVSGSVYSGADLTLPGDGGGNVESGILVAEGDITGLSAADTRRYGNNVGESPEVLPTRAAVPSPELRHHLDSQVDRSIRAACPDTGAASTETHSLALCLRAGNPVPSTGETAATVPSTVAAYLVVPGTTAGTIAIYTRATPPTAEVCADHESPTCDLAALATDAVSAGTHPAVPAAWGSVLTEALWPQSGVLSADADVYLGLCGDGFTESDGSCTVSTFSQPLTVISGTLGDPRDLYINGPISGSGLQAVATGQVYLPYWARPVAGTLSVSASLVGLDSTDQGAGVAPWPTTYPTAVGNQGDAVNLTGGVTAPILDLAALGYTNVIVSSASASPWSVAAGGGWQRINETPLTGVDLDDILS